MHVQRCTAPHTPQLPVLGKTELDELFSTFFLPMWTIFLSL